MVRGEEEGRGRAIDVSGRLRSPICRSVGATLFAAPLWLLPAVAGYLASRGHGPQDQFVAWLTAGVVVGLAVSLAREIAGRRPAASLVGGALAGPLGYGLSILIWRAIALLSESSSVGAALEGLASPSAGPALPAPPILAAVAVLAMSISMVYLSVLVPSEAMVAGRVGRFLAWGLDPVPIGAPEPGLPARATGLCFAVVLWLTSSALCASGMNDDFRSFVPIVVCYGVSVLSVCGLMLLGAKTGELFSGDLVRPGDRPESPVSPRDARETEV